MVTFFLPLDLLGAGGSALGLALLLVFLVGAVLLLLLDLLAVAVGDLALVPFEADGFLGDLLSSTTFFVRFLGTGVGDGSSSEESRSIGSGSGFLLGFLVDLVLGLVDSCFVAVTLGICGLQVWKNRCAL